LLTVRIAHRPEPARSVLRNRVLAWGRSKVSQVTSVSAAIRQRRWAASRLAAVQRASGCSGECPAEDDEMRVKRKLALSAAMLLAGLSYAFAQQGTSRTVEQYLCKDVMREHGDNRDVAIAFLQGYMLGKIGSSSFDLDALHKQTTDFIEYCLDHPAEKAADAMAQVKK
jgi:hypothetical protein